MKILFLIGLDELEQNLIIEESDSKSLPDLCRILSLPEFKMVQKYNEKHYAPMPPPAKKKRLAGRR